MSSTPVLTPQSEHPRHHQEFQAGRIGVGVFNAASLWKALPTALRYLDPRVMWHNPVMFVVEVGAVLSTVLCFTEPSAFVISRDGVAVADRAVRQPRRRRRRGPRQGPGRHPARHPGHRDRPQTGRPGQRNPCRSSRPQGRRPGGLRGRRHHPRRRGHRRRRRQRQRIGDHRRIRPGGPGIRRRPVLGHRRHHGALRPGRHQDHHRTGSDVRGPDDRPRRGLGPAEDTERDRAEHPAGQPDHRVPAGDHRAVPDGRLLRLTAIHRDPGQPAGLPDPHHHRRAGVRDRGGRDGPAGAAQRAGDERPGRRGRR